jgi:hypothetical protein
MKPTLASLLILTSALAVPLRAYDAQAPGIEVRLQQIDLAVVLKQYEQLKMELSRADFDLALKGPATPEAERNTLGKKVETLARRGAQLQREIRDQSGKISAALKGTPVGTPSIETRLLKIEMDVAIREYERVRMEGSRVELEQVLKATEASDADRKDLAKKGEMLARRTERLMKEIRERAEKVAAAEKESQPKAHAATGPSAEDIAKHKARHEEKKLASAEVPAAQTAATTGKPVAIFDGKTLAGWEGDPKLWRVENGCLTGGSLTEDVGPTVYLATVKDYGDFVVRMKIKLTGTGTLNSGFQIRSKRAQSGTGMVGYQCDYGEPSYYGAIYDAGRRNKQVATSDMAALRPVIKKDDWNELVIRAEGRRIRTTINGVQAADYTEADPSIAQRGRMGIQLRGGGKVLVQVKDIAIEELAPAKGGEVVVAKLVPAKDTPATPPEAEAEKKPAPAAVTALLPDTKTAEAEIAKAQKKLDALNEEIAKRRKARNEAPEGPEQEAADKLVQDLKPELQKAAAAVSAAKAKLKQP